MKLTKRMSKAKQRALEIENETKARQRAEQEAAAETERTGKPHVAVQKRDYSWRGLYWAVVPCPDHCENCGGPLVYVASGRVCGDNPFAPGCAGLRPFPADSRGSYKNPCMSLRKAMARGLPFVECRPGRELGTELRKALKAARTAGA